jgi:hypothetical protein
MTEEHEPEFTEVELRLSEQLAGQRPLPQPAFRGALGRLLSERDPGYGPRPERLRLLVAGLVGLGAVLVAAGALVALGV